LVPWSEESSELSREKQLPASGQFERLLNVPKLFQNVHENDIR